jgi:hypothetical protein
MKILISSRKDRSVEEEAQAVEAHDLCVKKHGADSTIFDWEVDWSRPDGEPEKFNAAIARVIPDFDVIILIEHKDRLNHMVLGRGQCRCADVALMTGRKVFVYRGNAFHRVKSLRISSPKEWKDGYGAAVTA